MFVTEEYIYACLYKLYQIPRPRGQFSLLFDFTKANGHKII